MAVKICDYCENRTADATKCQNCKNRSLKAGRDLCIERLIEDKGYKSSAKLRNIVKASEIVLFKDLCRVLEVSHALANKITTNSIGEDALKAHLTGREFIDKIGSFLDKDSMNELIEKKAIDNLDYVYNCAGIVYGSSIHASGTLLSKDDIMLPIDAESGDCHCNGHYAEELGYIKFDLLSLSALVPIEDILGIEIDWSDTSDNRELIEGLQDEDLTFVFQFGSPIVDNMIRGVDKKDLDVISLSEVTSINRPGPLGINLNKTWVEMKNQQLPNRNEVHEKIDLLKSLNLLNI